MSILSNRPGVAEVQPLARRRAGLTMASRQPRPPATAGRARIQSRILPHGTGWPGTLAASSSCSSRFAEAAGKMGTDGQGRRRHPARKNSTPQGAAYISVAPVALKTLLLQHRSFGNMERTGKTAGNIEDKEGNTPR
jgi:hypothetical protein